MGQNLAIYDQMDWWNPRHSLLQVAAVKFNYFHEKIGRLEGAHILDVGCGGGLLTEEFAKRGAQAIGVDLSMNALRTAREHAAAGGLRIHYELGKAEDLPAGDGLFDAVVCADCLEHVDDLERVISEVSRVLKNGGAFCYDTLNRNLHSKILVAWIIDPLLRLQYRGLNVSERDYVVHEWRRFIKPEELSTLMARHGLLNRETKGLRFAGFRKDGFKIRVSGKPSIAYIGYATKEAS